jgi:hypothetical protein
MVIKALLQFSWRRESARHKKGGLDSRGRARYENGGRGFKGLFSKNFISAFNILSILATSFFYPIHLFQLNLNPLLIISVFPVRN